MSPTSPPPCFPAGLRYATHGMTELSAAPAGQDASSAARGSIRLPDSQSDGSSLAGHALAGQQPGGRHRSAAIGADLAAADCAADDVQADAPSLQLAGGRRRSAAVGMDQTAACTEAATNTAPTTLRTRSPASVHKPTRKPSSTPPIEFVCDRHCDRLRLGRRAARLLGHRW